LVRHSLRDTRGLIGGPDDGEAIGVLALGRLEVPGSVDSQQGGHRVIRCAVEQEHSPAQRPGRDAGAPDRVADVVLAVAKGPLAVLPRFPPDHR